MQFESHSRMKRMASLPPFFIILLSLLAFGLTKTPLVISHPDYIPQNFAKFNYNFNGRAFYGTPKVLRPGKQASLEPDLMRAENNPTVITVAKNGFANFRTITEAVNSLPEGNQRRVYIRIGPGDYWEKITVYSSKPFITFYGDPSNMPRIVFNGTGEEYGTVYSATVAVESDYFMAVNIEFVNAAPEPDGKRQNAQAVAMRISGDKAAFHNCKFLGFQDTLCDDRGRHYFKNCYIRGTFDFIFGNGQSLYYKSTIESITKGMAVITAQARENVSEESGFTFLRCNASGLGNDTYLGRAWKSDPRVVYAFTYLGSAINTKGWLASSRNPEYNKTVYYGEYMNYGPGADFSERAKYAKLLSYDEARPFLSKTYIDGKTWIMQPPKL